VTSGARRSLSFCCAAEVAQSELASRRGYRECDQTFGEKRDLCSSSPRSIFGFVSGHSLEGNWIRLQEALDLWRLAQIAILWSGLNRYRRAFAYPARECSWAGGALTLRAC
jgi:hypothetical protein